MVPDDRAWVEFELRPEAHWHDGRPITAEDVRWSFETLKAKGRPLYRFYYANVTAAEVLGERRVRFSFDERNNRELPVIMGQLPVLPRHYWEGRDFSAAMALARFWCCDFSDDVTTIPVGRCVIRTAESVVFTCCPPAPDER